MNEQVVYLLFISCVFGFVGYMIGDLFGYSRGIHSAARIWEKSYNIMATAFMDSLKKDRKE